MNCINLSIKTGKNSKVFSGSKINHYKPEYQYVKVLAADQSASSHIYYLHIGFSSGNIPVIIFTTNSIPGMTTYYAAPIQ